MHPKDVRCDNRGCQTLLVAKMGGVQLGEAEVAGENRLDGRNSYKIGEKSIVSCPDHVVWARDWCFVFISIPWNAVRGM